MSESQKVGIFFMLQRKLCARSAPARSAAGAAAQRRGAPTGAAQRREAPRHAAEQRAPCKGHFCARYFCAVSVAEQKQYKKRVRDRRLYTHRVRASTLMNERHGLL